MTQTSQMLHFVSHDNQQIPYQLFPARSQSGPATAIVLLHNTEDVNKKIAAFGLPECILLAVDFSPGKVNTGTSDGSSALSLQGYYFQQFIEHITAQCGLRAQDIAAGQGRYIVDAIEKIEPAVEHLLLRDFDAANVDAGNCLLLQRGLSERARFEQGDAFSPADLATLPADRALAVVSGFYELFSDNNLVLASLNGLANAVKKGGYLVYTTKLWNPKLALMARILPSHQKGAFWLLRQRSQREIDQLVKRAGFAKVTQRVDGWGLFSVTLARKVR